MTRSEAHDFIEITLKTHPVVLFMKGTPESPLCGFSSFVVQVLNTLQVPFQGVDVLSDPSLREEIKAYSAWPTLPQLYIDRQFIGGCDITRDLYRSGELQALFARKGLGKAENP